MIERIYFVDPSDDERFYLQLFLMIVKDSTSFNNLYIFDDIFYDNFKSAYITHDLLNSDEQ
jgi:hypothetical protein